MRSTSLLEPKTRPMRWCNDEGLTPSTGWRPVLARPPAFLVGVLTEMGMRSPRVLTHVLSALLNQGQSHLRSPLDVPGTLGKLLGVELPRRAEYMAGGRWAKESYYGAVMRTAEFVYPAWVKK